jgi:phage terminase large subunit-like protein
MDYICPDINHLVACFTCGSQALPPYRLCESGHVGCRPCSAYLRTCLCTQRYVSNAHYVFDALVSALLLKCKYAAAFGGRGGDGETCDGRWFDVQQLRDHYRDGCTRNAYTCPLTGCGRADRIDTVVEHYEAEHDVRTPPPAEHSEHDEMVIRLPIT